MTFVIIKQQGSLRLQCECISIVIDKHCHIRVFYYVNIINSHQNYACQAIYLDDFYFCADPCGHETAANFVGIQYEHWTVPAHVLRLSGLC